MLIDAVFRAGAPLTETQMIGRGPVIEDLDRRLREAHKLNLVEPRRVGKSSVALAAVSRQQVSASIDVSQMPEPSRLTKALATQLAGAIAERADAGHARGWASAAAGGETEIAEALRKAESPGEALKLVAEAVEPGAAAIFVDEVHYVEEWPKPHRRAFREFLRNDTSVGVILASSEATAFQDLFGAGKLLEYVGQRYPLPDINREDWASGLRDRFASVGAPIEEPALDRLLEASGGHPWCTMLLAREAAFLGQQPGHVTDDILRGALLRVQGDPGWAALRDAH